MSCSKAPRQIDKGSVSTRMHNPSAQRIFDYKNEKMEAPSFFTIPYECLSSIVVRRSKSTDHHLIELTQELAETSPRPVPSNLTSPSNALKESKFGLRNRFGQFSFTRSLYAHDWEKGSRDGGTSQACIRPSCLLLKGMSTSSYNPKKHQHCLFSS